MEQHRPVSIYGSCTWEINNFHCLLTKRNGSNKRNGIYVNMSIFVSLDKAANVGEPSSPLLIRLDMKYFERTAQVFTGYKTLITILKINRDQYAFVKFR